MVLEHYGAKDSKTTWESDDCSTNLVKPFPTTGDYSSIPQFAAPELDMKYIDSDGAE